MKDEERARRKRGWEGREKERVWRVVVQFGKESFFARSRTACSARRVEVVKLRDLKVG